MTKPTEYVFTLPDGSERYEIVDPDCGTTVMRQINDFMKMHGAVRAKPLK